jgi:hypothetical protein
MPSFTTEVAELGEVEVTYSVIDPGLAPRYGEDPDPGHELELQIEETTLNGRPCSFGGLFVKLPWRYVTVDEWLLEQAYDYHGGNPS